MLLQQSFSVDYSPTAISVYQSPRTGLKLYHVDQKSPIVNGHFAVASEITCDSGAPHTLEHLVFMGSHNFPYKGLLDRVGNRLMSQTNAWTATDQTVYTLTTAGWAGFRELLPVYLDHLVRPRLTDAACCTEVYHVDGRGRERGVVFSEMQGIEPQGWFQGFRALQTAMYPEGSPYRSETGGTMAELRRLTADDIRQFHRDTYRGSNMALVVTGTVNVAELVAVVDEFDATLDLKLDMPRPFSAPMTALPLSTSKVVEFPDLDESMGEVVLGWIGPDYDDDTTNVALDMLGSYFCGSALAKINQELVEIESPMATGVEYSTDDYRRTVVNISASDVRSDELGSVAERIMAVLTTHADPMQFDLEFMRTVVAQERLRHVADAEHGSSAFSLCAVSDFIYAEDGAESLRRWTQSLETYHELEQWTAEQWCDVVRVQLVENPCASVLARPSAELHRQGRRENRQRRRELKERLGPDGLAELGRKAADALKENDAPIPQDVIDAFPRPDPAEIAFIRTTSYAAGANPGGRYYGYVDAEADAEANDDQFARQVAQESRDTVDAPWLHFEHFQSEFTTIHLVFSPQRTDPNLLRLLPFIEEIFSMPQKLPDGTYVPYRQVLAQLQRDLVEFDVDCGYNGLSVELVVMRAKFAHKNYARAVDWLRRVVHHSVFEADRIRSVVERILQSMPERRRSGELVMYSVHNGTAFDERSTRRSHNALWNEDFFRAVAADVDQGRVSDVQRDLDRCRAEIFGGDMRVVINGECRALVRPVSTWSPTSAPVAPVPKTSTVPRSYQFKTPAGDRCSRLAHVSEVAAEESTHLLACTPIPTDYLDPKLLPLLVAIEYLTAVEGPLWREIRGTGLAYGAEVMQNVDAGYLYFSVYRASDGAAAWRAARKIVTDIVAQGAAGLDPLAVADCTAQMVNLMANLQSNSLDASVVKVVDNVFRQRGPNYTARVIERLKTVTAEDVVGAMSTYVAAVFDSDKSMISSAVPGGRGDEFSAVWAAEGYEVVRRSGEEEEEEDEDEEESEEESDEESDSDSESDESD